MPCRSTVAAPAVRLAVSGPVVETLCDCTDSAVPMAARVSHRLGMEADPENMLLMHAMGPNVAGVIGSAVAAGVLLTLKDFVG